MDTLLESLTAACQGTGCSSHDQVGWCPAWNVWLCVNCRFRRNETELRITLATRKAMATAVRAVPDG